MKKYVLFAFLMLILCNSYGQSEKDSVAIMNLLKKEAATWRSGDVKAHADCWYIRPYSRILISTVEGKVIDLPPSLMVNTQSNMTGNGGYAIISNCKMGIYENSAWVSHEEESVSKDGKSSYSHEMRLLEKVKGEWKLVGQSIHAYKK